MAFTPATARFSRRCVRHAHGTEGAGDYKMRTQATPVFPSSVQTFFRSGLFARVSVSGLWRSMMEQGEWKKIGELNGGK